MLGVFGLYLGKVFDQLKARPLYLVKSLIRNSEMLKPMLHEYTGLNSPAQHNFPTIQLSTQGPAAREQAGVSEPALGPDEPRRANITGHEASGISAKSGCGCMHEPHRVP
jgi:hypothetical protein